MKRFARQLATAASGPSQAAAGSSSSSPFAVFDRHLKKAQRDRAASNKEASRLADYVKDEVAANMVDRLLVSLFEPCTEYLLCFLASLCFLLALLLTSALSLRLKDIKRRFPEIVDIGSGPGYIARHLDSEITGKVIMTDSSGVQFSTSSFALDGLTMSGVNRIDAQQRHRP